MPAFRSHRGLSLVEVTIMLLVLMLLTSVLAPSIFDFVNDARWVKVKEDCEAIAVTVARLTRDVGPCLQQTYGGSAGCTRNNRIDILVSDGPPAPTNGSTSFIPIPANTINMTDWWNGTPSTNVARMEDQFARNTPLYTLPVPPSVGPLFNLGWRGGYLSPPIGPDPWGQAYEVNSGFLTVARDVPCVIVSPATSCAAGQGQTGGGWERDVICVSAGPNMILETPFGGTTGWGTGRTGDDWVTIIQGSTR